MEEDGDGEDLSTPFWAQSNTDLRRVDRLRHRVSALFFSSGLVVLLLLVTAVFFYLIIIPKTLSLSAQIFRPNSVKKSWDSLNIVLVLVAVVFGFISKNKNDDIRYSPSPSSLSYYDGFQDSPIIKQNEAQNSNTSSSNHWHKSDLSTPKQWDVTYSDYNPTLPEQQNTLLRRNINSYPDLRDFSSINNWPNEDHPRRYYHDYDTGPLLDKGKLRRHYNDYDTGRVLDQGKLHRRHRSLEQVDNLRATPHGNNKTIVIDTLLSKYDADAKFPPADRKASPPQPPAKPLEQEKQKESSYPSVAHKREKSSRKLKEEAEATKNIAPPIDAAALSPEEEVKGGRSERKRGGASATKDFLNSLYHKKKNKKQRQKSVERLELDSQLVHERQPPPSLLHLPPPSPPPPVLKNLFSSRKHKRKRTITVNLKPSSAARESKPTTSQLTRSAPQISSSATHKLPKHKMLSLFDSLDEISNSGGESPLNRIPPAPPPPPLGFIKSPSWKFVVKGDYVRVNSSASSRNDSPETDDVDGDITGGGDATSPFRGSPLFCQSPDVDTKAESFISSFRAKLKLEKMHSMKREVGLSGLGPRAGPN